MLTKLKDENPGHYPFSDRWNQPTPGGALLQMAGNAHGTHAGWNYQSPQPGCVLGQRHEPVRVRRLDAAYQQMVTLLNGLYNKGLIDPESFTQSDNMALGKFTSGKSFAISENAQYVATDQKAMPAGADRRQDPGAARPVGDDRGRLPPRERPDDLVEGGEQPATSWRCCSSSTGCGTPTPASSSPAGASRGSPTPAASPTAPSSWSRPLTGPGSTRTPRRRSTSTYGFYNGVFSYGGSTQLLAHPVPAEGAGVPEDHGHPHAPAGAPARAADHAAEPAGDATGTSLMDYVQEQTLGFITRQAPAVAVEPVPERTAGQGLRPRS